MSKKKQLYRARMPLVFGGLFPDEARRGEQFAQPGDVIDLFWIIRYPDIVERLIDMGAIEATSDAANVFIEMNAGVATITRIENNAPIVNELLERVNEALNEMEADANG